MLGLLKSIKRDRRGASAAEYALMVAVMGAVVVTAAIALGGNIAGALDSTGAKIIQAQAG